MSASAAKYFRQYPELVLNARDARGYPFSVRQAGAFPADGAMPVHIPAALEPVEGPASLLGHSHDAKLWNMKMGLARGRLERRDGEWVFVPASFEPPGPFGMATGGTKRAKAWLAKRNLPWPQVDWGSIERMWADAKKVKDP